MMFLSLFTAIFSLPIVQDPNEPGLLDPVVQHLMQRPVRLPGSDQVQLPSEQINIVGRIHKKRADKGASATGKRIQSDRTSGPTQDLATAADALNLAASQSNGLGMIAPAQEIHDIILGRTSGRIYDGFSLLRTYREPWLKDQVAGEYKTKRLVDRGRTASGLGGRQQTIWEARVQVLVHADAMETDTCFLLIPADADPRDQLRIHYTIYSTVEEGFAPTTLLQDFDPLGFSRLPSKGYDAAWLTLGEHQITEVTVDQGMLGTMRGIQIWGWRADPNRSAFLQPVWQQADQHEGPFSASGIAVDAQGAVMMQQMAGLTMQKIGIAAPEKKLLAVANAVLDGATTSEVFDALNRHNSAPSGTLKQWMDCLSQRHHLPQEALDILAAEGIHPNQPGANRLGPYDAILVFAGHKLYVDALQRDLNPKDHRLTQQPKANDAQGGLLSWKVINLDATTHYLQSYDYGPALNLDLAYCYNAPWSIHSLEIFVDHPLQGAPKMAELQWRLGWSLRKRLGTVPQFDVFSQTQDQIGLTAFIDERNQTQFGWQYPVADRGENWRVSPPPVWRGGQSRPLQEDGLDGVVIGTTTTGFGTARMPMVDLSSLHPTGAVNTDTDGDGVDDALIFPDWLRNPAPSGGDLIPASKYWEPFLYLNPWNGTPFLDPSQPEKGLWAELTYAFGQPIAAGSDQTIVVRRPRSQGQAIWHADGLFRESTGAPSRTFK